MYVQDYNDFYPPYLNYLTGHGAGMQTKLLGPWVSDGSTYWPVLLYPYTKSMSIAYCPSATKNPAANFGANGNPQYLNYGANLSLFYSPATPILESRVVTPSLTYMLMDYGNSRAGAADAQTPTNSTMYLPVVGELGVPYDPAKTADFAKDDFESGRHFGGVNVCFADGHVKWLKSAVVLAQARETSPTLQGAWSRDDSAN
jgi:prepilin-type processing-associated H-X9-DG protein